ncbi:MAG: hypothetical protein PVH29_12095 [Candidatus Zixiibacteriota bacterium]|jgi:hypothetical protein
MVTIEGGSDLLADGDLDVSAYDGIDCNEAFHDYLATIASLLDGWERVRDGIDEMMEPGT